MKFQTMWNAKDTVRQLEKSVRPSKTRPDQSMTVAELVRTYASGLPYSGVKVPVYLSDDHPFSGVSWERMDLVEKEEFMKNARDKYEAALADVRNKQAAKKLEKLRDKMDKEIRHQIKQEMVQMSEKPGDVQPDK